MKLRNALLAGTQDFFVNGKFTLKEVIREKICSQRALPQNFIQSSGLRPDSSAKLFPVNHTALHHKQGMLKQRNVLKRIAFHRDNIGKLARLDCPNAV